jgi:hypothetical protein
LSKRKKKLNSTTLVLLSGNSPRLSNAKGLAEAISIGISVSAGTVTFDYKAWYSMNRERILAKSRARYWKNHEEALAQRRRYREAHRRELVEYSTRYNKQHPELHRRRALEYARRNQVKIRAYSKSYRKAHPEKTHAYYVANLKKLRSYYRAWRGRVRLEAIKRLGGKCALCGHSQIHALEIDHIVPLRRARRRGFDKSSRIELDLSRGFRLTEFQLLCANCHAVRTWRQRLSRLPVPRNPDELK